MGAHQTRQEQDFDEHESHCNHDNNYLLTDN